MARASELVATRVAQFSPVVDMLFTWSQGNQPEPENFGRDITLKSSAAS